MEAALLILSFFIFIVSIVNRQYRRSPLLLFSSLWFSIIFFYSLGAFGIYSSTDLTYKVYFYGIGSFFLGYIIIKKKDNLNIRSSYKDSHASQRKRYFKYCIIISIIIMLYRFIRAIPFWLAGGSSAVKVAMYGSHELNGTVFESILFTYFASPIQIASLIYVIISIFQKKKDTTIILLSIVLTILTYLASAGKDTIIMVAVLFFGYLLCNHKILIGLFLRTHKKVFSAIIIVLSVVCLLMSISGNFLQTCYFYLCGCIPMSDYALMTLIPDMPKFYGLMTFNGVFRILFQGLSVVGLGSGGMTILNSIFEYYELFQNPIMIAPTQLFNAYTSMFTIFYMDGGNTGVIILSLIFGILSALSQYNALTKPSYHSLGILLYVLMMIWGSMTRINIMFVYYALALLYIYIFFSRTRLN